MSRAGVGSKMKKNERNKNVQTFLKPEPIFKISAFPKFYTFELHKPLFTVGNN